MKKLFVILFLSFLIPFTVEAKEKYQILTLGDSITSGYGVSDTMRYPVLVKNYLTDNNKDLEIILTEEAVSGLKSEELILKIDNNERNIVNKIKEANLILVSIGSNDILKFLNVGNYASCFNDFSVCSNVLQELSNNLDLAKDEIKNNLDIVITKISNINSNALIYVVPFYNPFTSVKEITVLESLINKLDDYKKELNNYLFTYNSEYNLAFDIDLSNKIELKENINFDYQSLNFDPHPTSFGHSAIYESVINNEKVKKSIEDKKDKDYIYVVTPILGLVIVLTIVFLVKMKK